MPSLVATTYALARKPCVSTHYVRTNYNTVRKMDPKLLNIAIKIKIQTKISQKSNVYIFFLLFNLRSGKK